MDSQDAAPNGAKPLRKIVVIDDDELIRALVVHVLGSKFTILEAEDGAKGFDLVTKEAPDLVIVDFAMPVMHGFEVCRRIRQDPKLKGIKILMSSSKSYPHDIEQARNVGVNAYLIKPYRMQDLAMIVDRLLPPQ